MIRKTYATIMLTTTILFVANNQALHAAGPDNLSLLKTPPTVIDAMTSEQLNAFGTQLGNEVLTTLSALGSPTGQIGAGTKPVDKKAIQKAKSLYDDRALIQTSTLNFGLTKRNYGLSDIDEFKISNMLVTRVAPDVVVATYYVSLPQRVDLETGIVYSGQSMPRITVMRWSQSKKQWLIFSHADFDMPQATLCGYKPKFKVTKSHFKASDVKLGSKIINDLVNSKLQGEKPSVYAKGYQIVLASGERNTPSKPIASLTKPVEPSNLEAIRSGNLLAIRYDMPNALSVSGDNLAQKYSPRLLTYQLNNEGRWELIASAVYGVTARVAQDIKCTQMTAK